MLNRPRKLPQRFNRPVTSQTRNLVQKRLSRHKQYRKQRWQRLAQQWRRRIVALRTVFLRFAIVFVLGLALLIGGLAVFSPILDLREIRVQRSDPRINVERIQRTLAPLFGQHLLFLSDQTITEMLEAAAPDIKEVTLSKQYPSTLHIRLELDPVIARLKIVEPDSQATASGSGVSGSGEVLPQGDDFLTAEGMYVVYPSSFVGAGSGLLLIDIVDWGVRPTPGAILIEPNFLQSIRRAEEEVIHQFGQTIRSRAVYLRAREFHLQTSTYALWFDLRSPLQEQLQRYSLFLQTVGGENAKEYVDLRLKDKIVYK